MQQCIGFDESMSHGSWTEAHRTMDQATIDGYKQNRYLLILSFGLSF